MKPSRRLIPLIAALAAAPMTAAAEPSADEATAPATEQAPAAEPAPDPLAWRATPPGPGADTGWQVPVPVRFTLSNGIPVYLVERPGLPLVSVQLRIAAGRDRNPPGKAGLAALTTTMLDEGTKTRSALKLAEDVEALGAQLSAGSGADSSWISLDALSETLEPALDLMADVALRPAFSEKELERVKNNVLTELARRAADPRETAQAAFARAVFGEDHPYGHPDLGTRESVSALTRKDVLKFYKQHWHAGNAAFVVAGDIDVERARALLEARFGRWKARKAKPAPVARPEAPSGVRLVFVEVPGAVQSVIRFGQVSIPRNSPEYAPTKAMMALLGGMFSSRINMNLREEHGWSYGAYAGLEAGRDFGLIAGGSSVQADATAPAVAEILKEIREMREAPPKVEEVRLAQDALRGDVAGVFETNSATARFFASLPVLGLPEDAWRTYLEQVKTVTPDQVLEMARKQIDPDRLVIVVAGPSRITVPGEDGQPVERDIVSELTSLGLGPVERMAVR